MGIDIAEDVLQYNHKNFVLFFKRIIDILLFSDVDEDQWNPVLGALSSVDRDYGWFVNNISHNIHVHQIHHLFPIIPHYHLKEATVAFRRAFPHLVRERVDGSNVVTFMKTLNHWISAF